MWKPIDDYPNYEISDTGQVRNIKTGRVLKFRPNERGYMYVTLSKNSKYKSYRLHRLVASHFIPNPNEKPEVNHKDGDKQNNDVTNLEWVTGAENRQHAKDMGIGEQSIKVERYRMDGTYIDSFDSLTQAAFAVSGKTCAIKRVCEGKYKQSKGFVWKYKD